MKHDHIKEPRIHETRSHKRTEDVVTRRIFDSPNALSVPPCPLAAITGGILILRERKEKEKGEEEDKMEGRVREGIASSLFNFWLQAFSAVL